MGPRAMINEMTTRWQPFPSTNGALGSYEYFGQTIELRSVDPNDLVAALGKQDFPAQLKVLPLLVHEVQHLADHTSTVWGRDLLLRLFEVYAVRTSNSLEGYERIPQMMRELRTIDYSDYYTEYADLAYEPWDGKRWRYQFSAGAQLDANGRVQEDRPIVFTRFARQEDDAHICRVPFSVASLLEVRAMASEMFTGMVLCQKAGKSPEALIDSENWAEKLSKMFYDPFLTLYTVAAHCYSNKTHEGDPLRVFLNASAFAWLSLNLPKEMFPRLRIPDRFVADWGVRNEAMRANCDRGYLYLALVQYAPPVEKTDNPAPMLDAALRAAGLPPLAEVLDAVAAERKAAWSRIEGSPFKERLTDLLTLGDAYAAKEGLHPGRGYFLGSAPVPPFLLADEAFVSIPGAPTTGTFANPQEWLDQSHWLYCRLKEFVDACVA